MKAEVKNESERFQPIELTITIESEQELCDLWHRFNVSDMIINAESKSLKYPANGDATFWLVLEKLVKENKLEK